MTSTRKSTLSLVLVCSLILLLTSSDVLHACIDEISQLTPTQFAFLPNRQPLEIPQVEHLEVRLAKTKAKIIALTRQIAKEGKTAERYAERAELHVQLDQTHWAVVDYDDAIKLEPRSFSLRDRRLELNRELENFDQIEEDLNALIELDKSAIRYMERGRFYAERAAYEKAIEDFSQAIEFDPSLAEAYQERGLSLLRKSLPPISQQGIQWQQVHRVPQDLEKAIELDPSIVDVRRKLIWIYRQRGNHEKVIEHTSAILETIPDDPCAKYYRARAYHGLERYELALSDLNALIERNYPEGSKYIIARAEIYNQLNEVDEAIEDYRRSIKVDGKNYATYIYFARYLTRNGRLDEAVEVYSKAIELNTHNQELQVTFLKERAVAYLNMKRFDDSQVDLAKAIELSPDPANLKFDRARVLVQAGRYGEANEIYEDMMDDNPRHNKVFTERATMYIIMEEYDKAIRDVSFLINTTKHAEKQLRFRAKIWGMIGNEDEVQEDMRLADLARKYWEERRSQKRSQ